MKNHYREIARANTYYNGNEKDKIAPKPLIRTDSVGVDAQYTLPTRVFFFYLLCSTNLSIFIFFLLVLFGMVRDFACVCVHTHKYCFFLLSFIFLVGGNTNIRQKHRFPLLKTHIHTQPRVCVPPVCFFLFLLASDALTTTDKIIAQLLFVLVKVVSEAECECNEIFMEIGATFFFLLFSLVCCVCIVIVFYFNVCGLRCWQQQTLASPRQCRIRVWGDLNAFKFQIFF